jgi:hypothetical protein
MNNELPHVNGWICYEGDSMRFSEKGQIANNLEINHDQDLSNIVTIEATCSPFLNDSETIACLSSLPLMSKLIFISWDIDGTLVLGTSATQYHL